ncbi:MAG: hypothetical protein OXE41_07140 [Gammaproteobacteria bacterium]|nr:hypothetical protein [Gammaproteobacteria bacterium]
MSRYTFRNAYTPTSLITLVLLALLMTSCGFQLKGRTDIPREFSSLWVTSNDQNMIDALSDVLKKNGVILIQADSAAEIAIVNTHFSKSVETVNDLGVATGYAYRYSVEYKIIDKSGTVRVQPVVISQSSSLRYEVGNELIIEHEENFLKEQMADEIAGRIIRHLRWL